MNAISEQLTQLEAYEKMLPPEPPHGDATMRILYDIKDIIKSQTEGYSKWENIDTNPQDVRPILVREQVEPDLWIKHKGSLHRSEQDTLNWIVAEFNKVLNKPGSNDPDKQKMKMKMKMKAKALALELELELLTL
jgi:hypothetical protein